MRNIRRLIIYFTISAVIINFTYIFATKSREDIRFKLRRLFSSLIINQPELKPPAIRYPKGLQILTPNQLLRSKIFPADLEELKKEEIRTEPLYISPHQYNTIMVKDEKWKPLPTPEDGVEHKLDWQLPDWETHLRIYGRQVIGFTVGDSHYLKTPKSAEARARSSAVTIGFKPDQSLEIHIQGKVGKKVTIQIDSSGRQEQDTYKVEYNAIDEDEFIQRITAGNIGVSLPGSAFAVGSGGGTKSAFGIQALAKKKPFTYQAIASMTRGITEVKHFDGASQLVVKNIRDYDYQKRKYYLLNQGNAILEGSLKIYLDDKNKDNDINPVVITHTNILSGTNVQTNYCDILYSGKDYIVDFKTGFVKFLRTITDSQDILVYYDRVGQIGPYMASTSHPYNITATNHSDPGKTYIFLYKSEAGLPSPYEFRGIYYVGDQNIKKDDKDFRFFVIDKDYRKLDSQPFSEINALQYTHSGSSYSSYYIDEVNGYIYFNRPEPFLFPGSFYISNPDKSIYEYNPQATDSYYYLHMEYRYESRTFSLHWNIIPESELVFVDGRKLVRNVDYTIDYQTGQLEFKSDRVVITAETKIDVVYEYYPFGGSLQQILAGLRIDYEPYEWFKLGTVGFYNGKQTPAKVPTPNNATDNKWVGSVFGKFNFSKEIMTDVINAVLKKRYKEVPVSLSIDGEYAVSYYNINSFGQAMLEDFEGTIEKLSLSVYDDDWYLAPARPGSGEESSRGVLTYVDYYDHADDVAGNYGKFGQGFNGRTPHTNTYFEKPGPYTIDDGHLATEQLQDYDADQPSLVFQYDFAGKTNGWVGAIKSKAYEGGRDFRNYTDFLMWVRLYDDDDIDNAQVKLEIDIGEFSEDLDNDGILDEEQKKDDPGFTFNPTNGPIVSYIGGGPKYSPDGQYLQGNNRIDTEDLDGDGQLDRIFNEKVITLPDGNYAQMETGGNELIVHEGGWQLIRFRLNKDALDSDQKTYLKTIKHVRIRVSKRNGNKGRLVVNEMYFSGLSWKDVKINEQTVNTNNQSFFRVYPIASHDNGYYRTNSLRVNQEDMYDDLHGTLTEEESEQLNEHAYVIEYTNFNKFNFDTTVASNTNIHYNVAYATKDYSSPMDFRYYKKIIIWMYVPNLTKNRRGEYFFMRFGTVNNFFEYRKKIQGIGWQKLEIRMRDDEFLNLKPVEGVEGKYGPGGSYRAVGIPNLQNVNQISLGIYGADPREPDSYDGASGFIWVNDIYLDDVDKKKDQAYSINGTLSLMDNLTMNAGYTYKGKHFSQIGGVGSGQQSETYNLGGNWTAIQWMPVSANYSKSETLSDVDQIFVPVNQQGFSVSRTYSGTLGLALPNMPGIKDFYSQYWPSFNLSGSITSSTNRKPLPWLPSSAISNYKLSSFSKVYNLGVNASGTKVPFFDTYLKTDITVNGGFTYSHSKSGSIDYIKNATNINQFATRTNFNWDRSIGQNFGGSLRTGSVSITPHVDYKYTLVKSGTNSKEINTKPWNLSTRSRSLTTGLSTGKILFITPNISYNYSYSESGFYYLNNQREIDDFDRVDEDPFLRKNASTAQSFSLNVGSYDIDTFIFKSFTPSYTRSMALSQNDISAKTNKMLKTFNDIGSDFFLVPGYYYYLPLVNEHYNAFEFVRKFKDEGYTSSLSLNNSFSSRLGLEFATWSLWSLSYSFSQATSRSVDSYNYSTTWSLSGSSSLDLMDLFEFWIFRQRGEYRKSSTLSYGATYRETNNYLQKSLKYTITIPLNFNYRWSADSSIGFSLTWTYNRNEYNDYKKFYEVLEKDFDDLRKLIEPTVNEFPPQIDIQWNFSTSYSFKTKLAEYWKPPLFFKKPIKLGFDLNHTTTLSFMRHTYDYGNDGSQDFIHPKEMLFQIGLNHAVSFAISKNIDGGAHGKVVFEETREENGLFGDDQDDTELIISWEIGMTVTIRF
ncbi:MAG: hypothetical protein JW827_02520 [Spirochaetes bacterium]|nr:hypothetical protein [Spirochaetota bacterium]